MDYYVEKRCVSIDIGGASPQTKETNMFKPNIKRYVCDKCGIALRVNPQRGCPKCGGKLQEENQYVVKPLRTSDPVMTKEL